MNSWPFLSAIIGTNNSLGKRVRESVDIPSTSIRGSPVILPLVILAISLTVSLILFT